MSASPAHSGRSTSCQRDLFSPFISHQLISAPVCGRAVAASSVRYEDILQKLGEIITTGKQANETAHNKRTKVRREIRSAVGLRGGLAVIKNCALVRDGSSRAPNRAACNCGRTIENGTIDIGPTDHIRTKRNPQPVSVHDTMGGTSVGKHTADLASDMIARDLLCKNGVLPLAYLRLALLMSGRVSQ